MKPTFTLTSAHKVSEANVNFYANPFVHPERIMAEHDFIYMLQGEWKIGQEDKIYHLKKDMLLILPAGHRHFGVAPCSPGTKTMYFHITTDRTNIGDAFTCGVEVENCIDASANKNIKRCFSELVNCKLSGNQQKADVYFNMLLCELSETAQYSANTDVAVKIKNIILNHPEAFFSNQELAEMTNVSVKTAENKFRQMYKTTIHQFILNFKVEEAISYFDTFPQISIKETAHNLGFYDEYHFSKQFKKCTGLSPREYRIGKKQSI